MALYDESDVATLVRSRELADGMMRELSATMPRAAADPLHELPSLEPEELLPPPSLPPSNIVDAWCTPTPVVAMPVWRKPLAPTVKRKRKNNQGKRRARSHLHWVVLAMSVAIAVGLWRDPVALVNAKRQLTSETQRVVRSVSAKFGAVKADAATQAKRVSARVI